MLFLIGNSGKTFKGEKAFLRKILAIISRKRKVVESSNLVKFVLRLVQIFERKSSKTTSDLNAVLTKRYIFAPHFFLIYCTIDNIGPTKTSTALRCSYQNLKEANLTAVRCLKYWFDKT